MCTRNRRFERGFLCWFPANTTAEPELLLLKWHLQVDSSFDDDVSDNPPKREESSALGGALAAEFSDSSTSSVE